MVYVHAFTVSRPARKQRARHAAITQPPDPRGQRSGKSVTFWHELLGLTALEYRGLSHLRRSVGLACVLRRGAPVPPQESDYTHYAFTVAEEDFEPFSQRLKQAGVTVWKQNKSEGHRSIFSTRTGSGLSCTSAASPRGWRRVARSPTRAWCLPQTRLGRAPSACPPASRAWRHLPDCAGTPPPAVPSSL